MLDFPKKFKNCCIKLYNMRNYNTNIVRLAPGKVDNCCLFYSTKHDYKTTNY